MKKSILLYSSLILLSTSCGETYQPNADSVPVAKEVTANDQPSEPVAMSDPKVFYYDYVGQRGAEEALVMSKEDALTEMKNLPEEDGNFFGLELSDGKIVQFMYDEKKATWFLDIPNPVTQDSYNADVTRDDVLKIISDVYDGKNADDVTAAYK